MKILMGEEEQRQKLGAEYGRNTGKNGDEHRDCCIFNVVAYKMSHRGQRNEAETQADSGSWGLLEARLWWCAFTDLFL